MLATVFPGPTVTVANPAPTGPWESMAHRGAMGALEMQSETWFIRLHPHRANWLRNGITLGQT